MKKNSRKQQRMECSGTLRLSWETGSGDVRYAFAKFLDISRNGMGIQVSDQIPMRTFVTVRCDALKISGTGISRYCIRRGGNYVVGLEFSGGLSLEHFHALGAAAAAVI